MGWPEMHILMSIKMKLKHQLVDKFIGVVLHGLNPITSHLDFYGFAWPLHGFGYPGHVI
jgi:hypothetical protein